MIPPDLPAELKSALDVKLHGLSRGAAADRAAAISSTYRTGGGSQAIRTEDDALAYAMARMPATYAAVGASLNAIIDLRPDFAPRTLLDLGAGPGTASFAAAEAFDSLAGFTLLDANPALRALALELSAGSSRLTAIDYRLGDGGKLLDGTPQADLAIASYVINELGDGERARLAEQLWSKTRDTLLVVEPGTPAGYARIIDLRARVVALGGFVAAPCPHEAPCPLIAPDWCHFTQRLPRSRAHMALKDASVPFEDEKFAYVALTRAPPAQRRARVLAQPVTTKVAVAAKLCMPSGLVVAAEIPRRDKPAYVHAKRWRWGDAVAPDA